MKLHAVICREAERYIIMKNTLLRLITALLPAVLLTVSALAAEPADLLEIDMEREPVRIDAPSAGEEDLFSEYVRQRFYDPSGMAPTSVQDPARDRLSPVNQTLYDLLWAEIEETARNGGSSAYSFTNEELDLKSNWTPEELRELGFAPPSSNTELETLSEALLTLSEKDLNSAAVQTALLADCPYELYWFDKTKTGGLISGASFSAGYDNNGLSLQAVYTYTFSVTAAYQAPGSTAKAPVVRQDVTAVTTAVQNAASIVAKYQHQTDYIKLQGYKTAICDLTDYNHAAAGGSTAYGDPWQLIWVFDGDSQTNVVCEGYSKAFQYLCDLSAFEGEVDSYLVTGLMEGGTGAGPHMWNIVRIDGQSYLADVTNSDQGSAGEGGELFLAGAELCKDDSGSNTTGYKVVLSNGQAITYWYDASVETTWDSEILTLAGESYLPDQPVEENALSSPVKTGDTLKVVVSAKDPAYLLAAAYDTNDQFAGLVSIALPKAGRYSKTLPLPAGAVTARVLLAGQDGWAPLCASETA